MQCGNGLREPLNLVGRSTATTNSRVLHSPRGYGNTGWKAIFPNTKPREVDSIGTNVRRAFTAGTFPYKPVSRCTRTVGCYPDAS